MTNPDRRTKEFKAAQAAGGEIAPVRRRVASPIVETKAPQPAPLPASETRSEPAMASDAVPSKLRRKRASAGGLKLKLDAPQRPGFVRRWIKNDPSRIAHMREDMGYDFAEADTRTDSLGTRTTRHAGKGETGAPEQLVLMETPVSEYAIGVAEKEEQRQPFEQALRAGRATSGELTDQYEPRHDKSSLSHTGR